MATFQEFVFTDASGQSSRRDSEGTLSSVADRAVERASAERQRPTQRRSCASGCSAMGFHSVTPVTSVSRRTWR